MLEPLPKNLSTYKVKMEVTWSQSAAKFDELSWLGGFMDGEGCLTLLKRSKGTSYAPRITIVNTNRVLIDKVAEILGGKEIGHYIDEKKSTKKKWKTRYEVCVYGMLRCKKFLELIQPYLVGKAPQAKILKQFISLRLSKPRNEVYGIEEKTLFKEIRTLNGRFNKRLNDYTQDISKDDKEMVI